ncbi:MAG: hypothetical protein CMH71_03690 [Nitrosopumilales archaeon]|nr:hypothetical protein [Nitrosopumilales archaeon]
MTFFEISTTKYKEDIKLVQVAMSKMAAVCNIAAGFKFGEPTSRFGWTFFQLLIDQDLYSGIEDKFSDMIKKSKGNNADEKFLNFMSRYFETIGCSVKLKMTND